MLLLYPDEGPLRRELYSKHCEFFKAGAEIRERCMMAANRVGKTWGVGGYETALHLTGRYPDWWEGRRFDHPIEAWAAGDTSETTRDIVQSAMIGPLGEVGTGLIPAECIIGEPTKRAGVPGAMDTARIKHVSGGVSLLGFKSYDQGRKKFQGTAKHLIWLDEEPPMDVYTECLTRTMTVNGLVNCTFTPLEGATDVALMFLGLDDAKSQKYCLQATWDDVPHLSAKDKAELWAAFPAHEREARAKGIPALGSGRVFPITEEAITCAPFRIPEYWVQIVGVDFGIDHPFAAVRLAWDRDADVIYVTHCYKQKDAVPAIHAAAIKPWGRWLPVAWPHDGLIRDKGSGEQLADQYRTHGLKMLAERATHAEGGNGVEAGIMDMLERMETGRFKVFAGLNEWFDEFRTYHRKDGQIVKLRDDIMSATRYGVMMRRFATVDPSFYDDEDDAYDQRGNASTGY